MNSAMAERTAGSGRLLLKLRRCTPLVRIDLLEYTMLR